jgi:hypothetical protein
MLLNQASKSVTLPRDQLIRLPAPTPFPRFSHRPPPQRNVATLEHSQDIHTRAPDRKAR